MPVRLHAVILLLGTFFIGGVLACSGATSPEKTSKPLVLLGATIIPSPTEDAIPAGAIVIEQGRITAVGPLRAMSLPADADTINCQGLTIVAGFWNSHVHFTEPKWDGAPTLPRDQLADNLTGMLIRHGFTSVVDIGSSLTNTLAIRQRIESGEVPGPRIFTAGIPLYPANGVPYYLTDSLPAEIIKLFPTPATPDEAVRVVQANFANGADVLKLFLVTGVRRNGRIELVNMDPAIVTAATAEAHRLGKTVIAHPSNIHGIELALQGGVDVLAHTIQDPGNWTADVVSRLKAQHVALIPTVALFRETGQLPGILHEVKSYVDAGGRVLFGTDVGFMTDYADAGREPELLSSAGLTFRQILEMLTTAPAKQWGQAAQSGRIAPGLAADLVVLASDPSKDIHALNQVRFTLRQGRIIYKAQP